MFFRRENLDSKKRKRLALVFLVLAFSLIVVGSEAKPVNAMGVSMVASVPDTIKTLLEKLWDNLKTALKKAGSTALNTVIRNALNTIAYDTATWIGSGDWGQKPQFVQEGWEGFVENVENDAIGGFVEGLARTGTSTEGGGNAGGIDGLGLNLCEPDFDITMKIGLGLVPQTRRTDKDCSWQDFKKNWKEQWDKVSKQKDFLKNLAGTFSPTSNDLGIALSVQTGLMEDISAKAKIKTEELSSKQGWLDVRNPGGYTETYPNKAAEDMALANAANWKDVGKYTGDALVDALNVFLNQLAITALQTGLNKLTESTPPSEGSSDLLSKFTASPYRQGMTGTREVLKNIVEPRFNSRGDYDILAELTSCNQDMLGVSPTNCVIDDRLRQAIEQQKTVGEALKEGLLRTDAPFGFKAGGSTGVPIEPTYQEGIPYRSMMILRKFRIIPVGWELAAEKIQADPEARQNAYLEKLVQCFSDESNGEKDPYPGFYDEWCHGLVDPDWVLKAPQNYCAKEGYGPQIIYRQAIPQGKDSSDPPRDLPPTLTINRADNYCADEQSCIKERADGSCEYYGYCTEDKRKWKFSSNSCEPVFNSCQSFTSEQGNTISYLKDTLNFCSPENYGCKKYALGSGDIYDANAKKVIWASSSEVIYLNKNTDKCESDKEGCRELIRIKSGLGSNLIANSGFDENTVGTAAMGGQIVENPTANPGYSGPVWLIDGSGASIVDNGRYDKGLYVDSASSPAGLYSGDRSAGSVSSYSAFPEGFVMEPEVSYTLTADIYVISGSVELAIGRRGQYWEKTNVTETNQWVTRSVTLRNNIDILANEFHIYGQGAGRVQFYIDNIKFEIGPKATGYTDYRGRNVIYEKVLPKYLESVCYVNPAYAGDYRFKDTAPAVCNMYARKCNRDEANCELFTYLKDGSKIPAAVTDKDYCLAECEGYDAYIQTENNFSVKQAAYFIPKTAQSCNAAAVGCEEFTNLDKSSSGGETKEYYSYIRQCIKPGTIGANCAEFYTWEGSEAEGRQLKRYNLQAQSSGGPALTSLSGTCDEATYNLPPTDINYNPDCRQFYDRAGQIYYRLYSKTISCSDNCHPYRLSRKNFFDGVNSSSYCVAVGAAAGIVVNWDSTAAKCYYCANGGSWNTEHNACVYQGVEEESIACGAGESGCSEYNGNEGNNSLIVFTHSFEGGADGWSGGSVSANSAVSGQSSYRASGDISYNIGNQVNKGSSYVLTFSARGEGGNVTVNANLYNGADRLSFSSTNNVVTISPVVVKSSEWMMYKFNLPVLSHDVSNNETLNITFSGNLSIDDIKLVEVSERYYLVRDSWKTPDSCNRDENGNTYPLYMLGCARYKDRLNTDHYLHNFSRLCQESAVGCESMIETENNSAWAAKTYSSGDFDLEVPGDSVSYIVYDPNKKCVASDKGCERLGETKDYEGVSLYSDVFLKNNPDKYDRILCSSEGVGCTKWRSTAGDLYFKDPGEMVCEFAQKPGQTNWTWLKKKVKRCNGTGNVCSKDTDCARGQSCSLETEDKDCPVGKFKTLGQGDPGNEVYQPIFDGVYNWAGICPQAQSGCTEYIDPVSEFSINLIYNHDFRKDLDGNDIADGWDSVPSGGGKQNIRLDGNNLYVLEVEGAGQSATIDTGDPNIRPFYELKSDNKFYPEGGTQRIRVEADSAKLFYADNTIKDALDVANVRDAQSLGGNTSKIFLRKVVVDYQLAQEVDKTGCNGAPNVAAGCVYFNERAFVGFTGYASSTYNAWKDYHPAINASPITVKNANALLKVKPDRVCDKWLACKSFIKDNNNKNACFDIADCNRLDQGGNCANFVVRAEEDKVALTYDPGNSSALDEQAIKNLSGYSKVGWSSYSPDFKKLPNNLYGLGNMRQSGETLKVPNGDFENYDKRVYTWYKGTRPTGWNVSGATLWSTSTMDSSFTVVADPVKAEGEGISYPRSGSSFLKYNATYPDNFPLSGFISVDQNSEYYVSYWVNTLNLRGNDVEAYLGVMGNDSNFQTAITDATETSAPASRGAGLSSGHRYKDGVIYQKMTKDWERITQKIKIPSGVSFIRLKLGTYTLSGGAVGDVYVDDIQISPVLKAKNDPEYFLPQSCKLYPKEDSLSCSYFDDANSLQRGEYGYCLEYDRYPGNPDACLLWWPIDKVSGAGVSAADAAAAKGYTGRVPLYYCVGGNDFRPYIDTTKTWYMADESMELYVNDVKLTPGEGVGYDVSGGGCTITGTITCDADSAIADGDSCYEFLEAALGAYITPGFTNGVDLTTLAGRKDGYDRAGCTVLSQADNTYTCTSEDCSGATAGRCMQHGTLYRSACNDPNRQVLLNVPTVSDDKTKIYLNYGNNTIKYYVDSDHGSGVTFGLFGGEYVYLNERGQEIRGRFNLTEPNSGTGGAIGQPSSADINGVGAGNSTITNGTSHGHLRINYGDGADGWGVYLYGSSLDDDQEGWDVPAIFGAGDLNRWHDIDGCCDHHDDPRRYYITEDACAGDAEGCYEGGSFDGGDSYVDITIYIPPVQPCTKLANVVTIDGQNKAWVERVRPGSPYVVKNCNSSVPDWAETYWRAGWGTVASGNYYSNNIYTSVRPVSVYGYGICTSSAAASPFGSALPPEGDGTLNFLADPYQWTDYTGNRPLLYNPVDYSAATPARIWSVIDGYENTSMGQMHTKDSLSFLFAESYGIWDWNTDTMKYEMNNSDGENWQLPLTWCSGNNRPDPNDNCAVAPDVSHIKLNGNAGNIQVFGRGFVNVTFNTEADSQQVPISMYEVDWGDNEKLIVSGGGLADKPQEDSPYSVFHAYDYWDLRTKWEVRSRANIKVPTLNCVDTANPPYCEVRPRVKVRDNWGWCTEGRNGVSCPAADGDGGYCVNSGREQSSRRCFRNYRAGESWDSDKACSSASFPYCSDGYYESDGKIIVYKE